MSEQTLLPNRAGDQVRMQKRIGELEKAVADAHRILSRYQVACFKAGQAQIPASTVRGKINPAVWRLSKVMRDGE